MSTSDRPNVRTSRSVVDIVALRGYDNIIKLQKRVNYLKTLPVRLCSQDNCSVRLSKYNDTDFCAQHQNGNVDLSKFL